MRYVIVTGLSGAGKTGMLRHLEDSGFLCVDNLPPMMIPKFLELCTASSTQIKAVAMAVDIRGGAFFDARSVCNIVEDARAAGLSGRDAVSGGVRRRAHHPLQGDAARSPAGGAGRVAD